MELNPDKLQHSRFSGDSTLLESMRGDQQIAQLMEDASALAYQSSLRTRLLANAVRVDLNLIPAVARSMDKLKQRAGIDVPMEAYVYDESAINAFVAQGHAYVLVVLSSAAVNRLAESELEFVIGHELGHAVFRHLDVAASYLLQCGSLNPKACMLVLAWQRAAEISADRAGLICCGSLESAATALFKTLSGLQLEGVRIDPTRFAEQWVHLEKEVIESGQSDFWQLSHPFPPLRMKAMNAYDAGNIESDQEVSRLLAMMDPLARESKDSADPMLADFFLWGGLYIALSDTEFHPSELEALATVTSRERIERATASGLPDVASCAAQFKECISRRRQKLKALEIHRILQGLMLIAAADGQFDDHETKALVELAGILGVDANACALLISNFKNER